MSHFAVMVIGENFREQLAPYNENLEVEPYKDYIEEKRRDWYQHGELQKDEKGYYVMSTFNPRSKWDWYVVGGRWAGYFKPKGGSEGEKGTKSWCIKGDPYEEGHVDQIKKGDIDIEGMLEDSRKRAEINWEKGQETTSVSRSFVYGIKEGMTRDQYIKAQSSNPLTPFALVKNGEWYQRGSMGWWGCVSDKEDRDEWNSEFQKLFDSLPDDTLLTLVDYHI